MMLHLYLSNNTLFQYNWAYLLRNMGYVGGGEGLTTCETVLFGERKSV